MTRTGDPVVMNPYAHWFHANPFPVYERLREEEPVYRNDEMGFFALTRFDDVFAAFHDHATFSSASGVALESIVSGVGGGTTLIEEDPPEHTRLRKMVGRMFTMRRVAQLEADARRVVDRWIERFAGPSIDFVGDFSGPVPMDVISEMLAVPRGDRDALRRNADLMVAREDGSMEIPPATLAAFAELTGYFRAHLDRYRADDAEGLIAELCAKQAETSDPGDAPTDEEIVGLCLLFIIAGHETTTKMLANAVDLLEQHPDQRAELVREPALIPRAIEEVMRFNNSSQYMARVLTRDLELHGVVMTAGSPVLLVIGAAGRDPREFDAPDRFDIHREIKRSLAFGHGAHFCLGAHLARLEGRVALEVFLTRYPRYIVDRDAAERIHSGNVMGWSRLPMLIEPADRTG